MRDKSRIMLSHISEEPVLIRGLLEGREEVTADFCRLFLRHGIRRAYFSGSGSPANACEVLSHFCRQLLGLDAVCLIPALFNHHQSFNTRDYSPEELLLICPAESGRTKGTLKAAQRAAGLGIHTACCTYDPGGLLGRTCEVTLCKPSGREVALPSTKGHTTGIFLFLLCFVEAARALGRLDAGGYARCLEVFRSAARYMEEAVSATQNWFDGHQTELMDSGSFWFVAYGANLGTAREGALKFLECTGRPSFAYELEEFMHGPLAAVRGGDTVFFLAAEPGPERGRLFRLAEFCGRITPRCVPVCSMEEAAPGMPLRLAMTGRELGSVLELLVPLQTLAYEIAACLGRDLTKHSPNSAGRAMGLSVGE